MISFPQEGASVSHEITAILNAVACAPAQTLPEVSATRGLGADNARSALLVAEGLGYVERRGKGRNTQWHLTARGRVLLNG